MFHVHDSEDRESCFLYSFCGLYVRLTRHKLRSVGPLPLLNCHNSENRFQQRGGMKDREICTEIRNTELFTSETTLTQMIIQIYPNGHRKSLCTISLHRTWSIYLLILIKLGLETHSILVRAMQEIAIIDLLRKGIYSKTFPDSILSMGSS